MANYIYEPCCRKLLRIESIDCIQEAEALINERLIKNGFASLETLYESLGNFCDYISELLSCGFAWDTEIFAWYFSKKGDVRVDLLLKKEPSLCLNGDKVYLLRYDPYPMSDYDGLVDEMEGYYPESEYFEHIDVHEEYRLQ